MTKRQKKMLTDLYDDARIYGELSVFEQSFLLEIRRYRDRDRLSKEQAAKLRQIWDNVIGSS